MRRFDPLWVAPLLTTIVLAALEVYPLARHPGVPAFSQDWLASIDRAQCAPMIAKPFEPWRREVVGGPPIYPIPWWPSLLTGTACAALGPHAGIIVLVSLVLIGIGLSAAALARELGCGAAGCSVAAGLYLANPIVLNKLEAGHITYLAAYALLPLIAHVSLRQKGRLSWLVLGMLLGVAAAQPQFLGIGLAVAWIIAASKRNASALLTAAAATAVAVGITAPQWLPSFFVGTSALDVAVPLRHWEMAQSVTPADAPRFLGYIGGYDARLLGDWVPIFLWLMPAGALAGLISRARDARAWVLAIIALVGIVSAEGLRGPAAMPIDWAFAHLPVAAVFRELYDLLALTALGTCMLAGIAVAAGLRHPLSRMISIAAMSAITPVCVAIAVLAAAAIPSYDPPASDRAALQLIKGAPDERRFMPIPSTYPVTQVRSDDGSIGGYSPYQLAVGSHDSAAPSPFAVFPISYALGLLRNGRDEQARVLFERAGVGFVLTTPDLRSNFKAVVEPALRPIVPIPEPIFETFVWRAATAYTLAGGQRVAVEPFSARAETLSEPYAGGSRDVRAVSGGVQVLLFRYDQSPDPREAWARTALWPILPSWIFAEPLGAFTLRTSAPLDVPPGWVVAGSPDGPPASTGCKLWRSLDAHFGLLRCHARPTLSGRPPLVISSVTVGGVPASPLRQSGTLGIATLLENKSWRVRVQVRATAGSVIVLRDAYDGGWVLDVPDARHVEVDGYANGWVISRPLDRVVTISYRLALPFAIALAVSIGLVALGMAAALAAGMRR